MYTSRLKRQVLYIKTSTSTGILFFSCESINMKRVRSYVETCNLCDLHFESTTAYIKHCDTRNHKHKLLVKNSTIMETDEDNSLLINTVVEFPPFCPLTSEEDEQEMMATPPKHTRIQSGHSFIANPT